MASAKPYSKSLICLANSRKLSGSCVAGREVSKSGIGGWIRPVSVREKGEISAIEQLFTNGKSPQLLDVVRIQLVEHRPIEYQTENHLIDAKAHWVYERRASWQELLAAVESPRGALWLNNHSSTNGVNDRVPLRDASELRRSLYLIHPDKVTLVAGPGGVRAHFDFAGHQYGLKVTDPVIERQYKAMAAGTYEIADAILCVSLGEPFKGYAYKLVAGVILQPKTKAGK